MMKSGVYGKYKGIEYKVTGNMQGDTEIITKDVKKIDSTFEDTYNSGVFSKVVNPNELTDCVSIITYGIIQGKKVQILKEREMEYKVATSSLLIGDELNLPRIDRDSWVGWVPKSQVQVLEEKTPIDPDKLK